MWLLLAVTDKVQRTDSAREFPFDASLTNIDLFVNGYGSALKSAATVTVTIPVKATFPDAVGKSMNGFGANANFQLPTGDAGKTGLTGQPTGMVSFKWLAGAWGGSCCVSSCNDDTSNSGYWRCDLTA